MVHDVASVDEESRRRAGGNQEDREPDEGSCRGRAGEHLPIVDAIAKL